MLATVHSLDNTTPSFDVIDRTGSFARRTSQGNVPHTNAHGGRILECDFVFASWYPINKTSLAIVDANNDVDESQEGNNQDGISPFGVTH